MTTIEFSALREVLRPLGRCREYEGKLWFNWSCSGFALRFRGKELFADFEAISEDMTAPFEHEPMMMEPVIAIHVDGGEEKRVKLRHGSQRVELFSGSDGEHCVYVRKLSENVMGKCAVCALETDGEMLAPPDEPKLRLEFVGDSITCGYGNESSEPGFRTETENGERAFGFLCAEALGADYSAISVSGCCVPESLHPGMINRGMLSMYELTDAPFERLMGSAEPEKWDFTSHPRDAVIINLGTNDAFELGMQAFSDEAHGRFKSAYLELVRLVRSCNGPDTRIFCVLGSMDYYVWDEIVDVVSSYKASSGDERIFCAKLGKQNFMIEGNGSDGHPSAQAHERMAKELSKIIKNHLN